MTIGFINKSFALFILLANLYFVYGTCDIIRTQGGPMGITLIALPVFLLANFFIISAVFTYFKDFAKFKFIFYCNTIGTILIIGLIFLLLSS